MKEHDPVCLSELSGAELANFIAYVDPSGCEFCIHIAKARADERAEVIRQVERLLANESYWEYDEIRPGLVAALAVIKGEWKFNLGGEEK